MPIRLLIVDDSPAFLDAASDVLAREGLDVVATAATAGEAVERVREHRPDVVLIDIGLGGESGLDLSHRLAELNGDGPKVILISTRSESDYAEMIAETPALGFVPKIELSARRIEQLVDRAGAA